MGEELELPKEIIDRLESVIGALGDGVRVLHHHEEGDHIVFEVGMTVERYMQQYFKSPLDVLDFVISKIKQEGHYDNDMGIGALMQAADNAVEFLKEIGQETLDAAKDSHRLNIKMGKELERISAELAEMQTRLTAERTLKRRAQDARDSLQQELKLARTAPSDSPEVQELSVALKKALDEAETWQNLAEEAERERDDARRARANLVTWLAETQPQRHIPEEKELEEPEAASMLEVLERGAHPLLAFSLDLEKAKELDSHERAPAWRRRLADTLADMAAYAEAVAAARAAGEQPGIELANFNLFLQHHEMGSRLSPKAVSLMESNVVMQTERLAALRIFPCPPEVEPTGEAAMFSTVWIGGVRPPAPRVHFLDDTKNSGKIVIGYVGEHLRTNKTN